MKQIVIENPVINSPFAEPQRHFKFDEDGITDQIVESRRISSYFIPIARPKKKGKQLTLSDWTADRIEENKTVNAIRQRVKIWREGKYPDVTRTTSRLLEQWRILDRIRPLFFCQIEAMETIIYVTEVAKKYGDTWIENDLRRFNEDANPKLFRVAFKMATGSGKTTVMAMLIAWHMLNKLANPQDARFTDTFLIVTPGITIRDRLRVLLPSDPQSYYRTMEMLTEGWDANTVTHILGIRAFGTQLLCEQVVGRGLRRISCARVSTAKVLWIASVNNAAVRGRWAVVEIDHPWNAKIAIRASLREMATV